MKLLRILKIIGIKLVHCLENFAIRSDGNISIGKFFEIIYQNLSEDRPENIITNRLLLRIVDQDNYQIDSYPIGNNILKNFIREL